jgi:hypothetical protein
MVAPELQRPVAAPVQTVSSFSDPFAFTRAQTYCAASAGSSLNRQRKWSRLRLLELTRRRRAQQRRQRRLIRLAGMSAEDADTHRKAQRFARLLVDEIKLYNQAKVAEGRRHKDLYDRLKDDIEKSRGTFQKRYGGTAAANADYFSHELLRSLAEDDISIMGANFRR